MNDRIGELLTLAERHGIVSRSGSWYAMGETRLGQGRDKARTFLSADLEAVCSLERAVLAALSPAQSDTMAA